MTSAAFGELGRSMRMRRLALDLTQAALARQANCSPETVKRIEHGERRPSKRMASALADALRFVGDERARFVAAATGERVGVWADPEGTSGRSVPTWTAFVGRRRDLEMLDQKLRTHRLVTIHGPGGVGKSRLAAQLVAERDPRKTFWVEFPSSLMSGSVEALVARALRIRDTHPRGLREAIAARIGDESWLIVLDNCEHRVDEVARFLRDLLSRCPGVKVLVASRTVTRVAGEARWPLAGLPVPTGVGVDLGVPLPESMQLFVERAREVEPQIVCDGQTAAAIAQICRTLDGLPLAIELAAARVDLYPPADLAERIRGDAAFLRLERREGEARYRNLVDMVQWSLSLVDPTHREWLACLAIFVTPFGVEAARAVACPEVDLETCEDGLRQLLDASLLTRPDPFAPRFHMLETIRAVLDQALSPQERDAARTRHSLWCAQIALESSARLWGVGAPEVLDELAAVHLDFGAAVEWSCRIGDAETANVLVGSLSRYWDLRGHLTEGVAKTRQALALEGPVSPAARISAENGLGTLTLLTGDLEVAAAAFERAAAQASSAGMVWDEAYATQFLGLCAIYAQDLAGAQKRLSRSASLADRAGDAMLEGWSFLFLAAEEMQDGNIRRARLSLGRARNLLEAAVEHEGLGWTCVGQAALLRAEGRGVDAWEHLCSAWEHLGPLRAGWGTSVLAIEAGHFFTLVGERETAAQLLRLSDELREVVGAVHLPVMEGWRSELDVALRAAPHFASGRVRVERQVSGDLEELFAQTGAILDKLATRSQAKIGR